MSCQGIENRIVESILELYFIFIFQIKSIQLQPLLPSSFCLPFSIYLYIDIRANLELLVAEVLFTSILLFLFINHFNLVQ